jgi:Trypsin-like peptidase domain
MVQGVVSDDPIKNMPLGSVMNVRAIPILGTVPDGAATIKNWEFFEGVVVFLSFTDQVEQRVEGSGVLVAPGIALCATHVIEPHMQRLMTGNASATCFGIASHGLQIWNVRKITSVPETDVTILGLELASNLPPGNTLLQSIVSTRTPAVGEKLQICGFRANSASFSRDDRGGVTTSGEMWVSQGTVLETHPFGRDRAMITWPVLAVDVPALGGMSGGPVYDGNGLLVGILCSSFDYADGTGTSFVSLLWPALAARFYGAWPAGLYPGQQSLLELPPALCAIDGRDAVFGKYDQPGITTTNYRPWQ